MLLAATPPTGYDNATDHILDELDWLDLLLVRHVARLKASGLFNDDPFRGLYISDAQMAASLAPNSGAADAQFDCRIANARAAIDARLAATQARLPLPGIAARFGLDAFAAACLVIAAAPCIDRRYATLFAYAQNDVARKLPSVDLVLSLLADDPPTRLARLTDFAGAAPLLRDRLLRATEADAAKPLTERALIMDDRMVFALLGHGDGPDERLAPFVRMFAPGDAWEDKATVERCVAALAANGKPAAILLDGAADSGQRQIARGVCRRLERSLIEADLCHPAASAIAADELGAVLAREAMLVDAGLLLAAQQQLPEYRLERVIAGAARSGLPLFLSAEAGSLSRALFNGRVALVQIELPARRPALRGQWWQAALRSRKMKHPPALPARLGMTFRLGPNRIGDVVEAAAGADDIMMLARSPIASDVPSLARRVRPHWTWDDLVLPPRQRDQLQRLCAVLEHAPRVMSDWGFVAKTPAGHNTIALFSGPSGTGKTMAASLIASSVGLHLYACNVASIFDKYVGETEKNLDRLFNEAERANAILLFDEADVLFSVRTEVNDGHDRYGNLSVGYLLQRVESYDGLIILSSNLAGNMDEAFSRRLSHVVLFPTPDAALRRELWARAFPREAPRDADVDMDALARSFELSGGNIRNAALAAAYLAAGEGGAIARRHVLKAIASELEKMGRRPISADFNGFAGEIGLAPGA